MLCLTMTVFIQNLQSDESKNTDAQSREYLFIKIIPIILVINKVLCNIELIRTI